MQIARPSPRKRNAPARPARRGAGVFLALSVAVAGLVGPATAWAQRADSPRADAPPPRAAPHLRFQHLSIEDGLSQSSVYVVLTDRRGFMWFGTGDGLNRYDGYRFVVYQTVPFDTTSIIDGAVLALAEDPVGGLWVGTPTGLARLDPGTDRFRRYAHDPNDPNSLSPGGVSALQVDPSGDVWVGMVGRGLSWLDVSTGRFRHYRHDPRDASSLSSDDVSTLHRDPDGVLWVGTRNGLNRFIPSRSRGTRAGPFQRYLYNPDGARPNGNWGAAIDTPPARMTERAGVVTALRDAPDARGVLWVATQAGLVRLDTRTGLSQRFTPDAASAFNVLTDVLPDPRTPGVLWVTTLDGLYHFDTRAERFTVYRHDPEEPSSIVHDYLFGLHADRTGLIWVNT